MYIFKKGQDVDPNFEDCISLKYYCNFKYLLYMVNTSYIDGLFLIKCIIYYKNITKKTYVHDSILNVIKVIGLDFYNI